MSHLKIKTGTAAVGGAALAVLLAIVPFERAQANPMANDIFGMANRNVATSGSARAAAVERPASTSRRGRAAGVQVASLGGGSAWSPWGGGSSSSGSRASSGGGGGSFGGSLSGGGGVRWAANANCLNGTLQSAIASVAAQYGSVTVSSTCRSAGHNARVGGAPRSHHLTGDAADFRVHGANPGAVYAALRANGSLGGVKHYGGGLFHIDTGPKRGW